MATASEVSIVESFINKCDLEGLQQFASEKYNWNQNLAEFQVVPLAYAISRGLEYKHREPRPKYLVMIEWMLRSGADPLKEMTTNASWSIWITANEDATKIQFIYNRHSPLSFVLKMSELLRLRRGGASWSHECKFLDEVLALCKKATSSKSSDDRTVRIHADVVRLWEISRETTSTHNVVFQTEDGEVSAHDHILIAASPVLKAMLESPMREGSTKCIPVKDSSSAGVSLFLDLLYTSSTCLELDYKTMLVAFDVAHRWQVPHVVGVLADVLRKELTVDSFAEIAEAAMLKGSASLQQACATFGAKHDEIQAKKETMPPVVRQLLGLSYASLAEPGNPKRRRF
ncbi:klhl36 [Symbiodinium sp. CCMP2592]|nr:klhl36 [Symbiodinium sp. CCMP2592]